VIDRFRGRRSGGIGNLKSFARESRTGNALWPA